MGKLGAALLVGVAAYLTYSIYIMYSETQPPVYRPKRSDAGDEGPPPLSSNRYSPDLLLSYEFFLSPFTALPPLQNLLAAKNEERFFHVGSVKSRPYNWEGEERLREAEKKNWSFQERLRESLNFSGKEKSDLEVIIPEFLRNNVTLFVHVRTRDAKTGEELPLQAVQKLSSSVVPEHLKVLKRYLLEDPWGTKLEAATKELQVPPPPVESVPEYIQVGPVLEHRPLLTEALLRTFGLNSPVVDIKTQTYALPIHLNSMISPEDEHLPLVALPHERFVVLPEEQRRSAAATSLKITYKPTGYASWLFLLIMGQAMGSLQSMKFSAYDVNSVKMMMGSSSPWVLLLVYLISLLHLVFEILALYSDVKFWRGQENLAQNFSANGLLIEMALEVITILYVRDNGDSFLVQIFIVLRLLLNVWKLRKLVTFTISSTPPYFFKIRGAPSSPNVADGAEPTAETEEKKRNSSGEKKSQKAERAAVDYEELQRFENACMWYLCLLFLPMVLGVSLYQLIYVPQKGWWSWLVTSLATCGYTFGFVSMTPQLFRNYKLQSVTHMPWRVLGYQFTNTFIDDVFSCFIRMPKMHRMSVFRDDVVFVVFLVQRWLYRHNKQRDDEEASQRQEVEEKKTK
ncbi:putative Cleft lip and palate transmembrane protein 1 [Neospora caninum Liverpool]|uniref:Cleft lip and palate transmembrane protein 1,putative n=1 Tax=Neospora caninum (strain Liverpool) TaxID=572307 RepID=F0V9P3_NEOCL|nr:putative Cleft lip and palate transmembrane protein 1 [Neospora caninum Liverpool]CBZ50469.1 putative Cleft lip and palate transmembrane protein 1 [Neospora caninum Liverpool]CEL65079.1 TPA: Cleft lip and palate transmembrane protein 1,putative [Neospora caninum Liverpool]|eukprot:XP_003880502.1 putative Cleft lip and palate transmembrane protein 1 [Neospora caninum Liverpool]